MLFCYNFFVSPKYLILPLQKPGGIIALLDEAWYERLMIFLFLVAILQLYRTLIYLITFNLSAFAIVLQYVAEIDT